MSVGGSGRIHDHRFRVLGRVRYGYEMGYWDEWYLALDDGSTAWVSEDERELTLERLKTDQTPNISYAETQPGDNLRLGKKTLQVAEKGVARCEGSEGQFDPALLHVFERCAPQFDRIYRELTD